MFHHVHHIVHIMQRELFGVDIIIPTMIRNTPSIWYVITAFEDIDRAYHRPCMKFNDLKYAQRYLFQTYFTKS